VNNGYDSPAYLLGAALIDLLKHPGLKQVELVVHPRYPKDAAPIDLEEITAAEIQSVTKSLLSPKPLQSQAYWAALSLEGSVLAKFPETEAGKAEAEQYVADSLDAVRVARVRTTEGLPSLGEILTGFASGIRVVGPTDGAGVP
jgi:hypothetical protein